MAGAPAFALPKIKLPVRFRASAKPCGMTENGWLAVVAACPQEIQLCFLGPTGEETADVFGIGLSAYGIRGVTAAAQE